MKSRNHSHRKLRKHHQHSAGIVWVLLMNFEQIFFLLIDPKKLASVGPSGEPMVTPSICLYKRSLNIKIPCVAMNINFLNTSLLKGATGAWCIG